MHDFRGLEPFCARVKAWKTTAAYEHKELYLRCRGGQSSRSAVSRWRIEPEEIAASTPQQLAESIGARVLGLDPEENPKIYVEAVPTGSSEVVDSWSWAPDEATGGQVKIKPGQSGEGAAIVALTGAVVRAMDFNTKLAIAAQETALGMVERWHEAKKETLDVVLDANDEIAAAKSGTDAMDRAVRIFEPLIPGIGALLLKAAERYGATPPASTSSSSSDPTQASTSSTTSDPTQASTSSTTSDPSTASSSTTEDPPVRRWEDLTPDERGDALIAAVRRLVAEHPEQGARLFAAYMGGQ